MPLFCREQPPKPAPSTPTHMRTPLTSQTPHQQPPNHHYQLSSHSSHNNNHKKINFILLSAEKPRTQATLSKSQGKENRKGINVVSKDKMKNYKINASNYSMETPQRNKTERQREETVKRKEVTYFDHNYEANPLTEILKIKQPCFQNVLPLQSKNPSQYNSKIMSKIIAQRALYSKIKELNKWPRTISIFLNDVLHIIISSIDQ